MQNSTCPCCGCTVKVPRDYSAWFCKDCWVLLREDPIYVTKKCHDIALLILGVGIGLILGVL